MLLQVALLSCRNFTSARGAPSQIERVALLWFHDGGRRDDLEWLPAIDAQSFPDFDGSDRAIAPRVRSLIDQIERETSPPGL